MLVCVRIVVDLIYKKRNELRTFFLFRQRKRVLVLTREKKTKIEKKNSSEIGRQESNTIWNKSINNIHKKKE